ncbi:MAG TPA: thioesterase family protein [Burkholderiales bacterium]|nr:thioesterase family protein [Burkholderiales bacterium]
MARQEPETRERYVEFVPLMTRWMDNDLYNHVNNVVFYSFFDTAVNGYMVQAGVLDLDASPVIGLVVETACQYFSPISFPDRVYCGLRVAHLGTSSVRFEIGVFRNEENVASAQGHFVHVTCDRTTHRPVPMPANMRAALERLKR